MWLHQTQFDPERTYRRAQRPDLDPLCGELTTSSFGDCAHVAAEEGEGEVEKDPG